MLSIIKSMSLQGFEGLVINVEVDVSNGLPCWEIVGLPDTNIKESKERIKTAINKHKRSQTCISGFHIQVLYFC